MRATVTDAGETAAYTDARAADPRAGAAGGRAGVVVVTGGEGPKSARALGQSVSRVSRSEAKGDFFFAPVW